MDESTIRERLEKLPVRSIVAFAARCARRVQPLFNKANRIPDFRRHRKAVDHAIGVAEMIARETATALQIESNEIGATLLATGARAAAAAAGRAAGNCVAAAAARAAHDARESSDCARRKVFKLSQQSEIEGPVIRLDFWDTLDRYYPVAKHAAKAAAAAMEAANYTVAAMDSDLRILELLAASAQTKGRTLNAKDWIGDSIDPSEVGPLGPLWPDNTGSAAESDSLTRSSIKHDLPPLTVYVDAGAAELDTIRDLFLALSAVYEAQGGAGLKIVKHEQRILVGEEVPV